MKYDSQPSGHILGTLGERVCIYQCRELCPGFNLLNLCLRPHLRSTKNTSIGTTSGSVGFGSHPIGKWDYVQDCDPRIGWPPGGENGGHEFDPERVVSVVRQSFAALRLTNGPVFQGLHNFYKRFSNACATFIHGLKLIFGLDSVYSARYYYDYSSVHDNVML